MQGHSIRSGAPERLQIESTAITIGGCGWLHADRQGAQCRLHPGPRGGTMSPNSAVEPQSAQRTQRIPLNSKGHRRIRGRTARKISVRMCCWPDQIW